MQCSRCNNPSVQIRWPFISPEHLRKPYCLACYEEILGLKKIGQKLMDEYNSDKFQIVLIPAPKILCFGNREAVEIIAAAYTADRLFESTFGKKPGHIQMHPDEYAALVQYIMEEQGIRGPRSDSLRLVGMKVSVSYGMAQGTLIVSAEQENFRAKS